MRFFSPNASIAVLPPTALSAWASKVVGMWMTGQPRLNRLAARPATSPTEPPPKRDDRRSSGWRCARRARRAASWSTSHCLAASPSGRRIGASAPSSARDALAVEREDAGFADEDRLPCAAKAVARPRRAGRRARRSVAAPATTSMRFIAAKRSSQRGDDRVDDVAMRAVAAADVDVGLGIGGAAFLVEPGERLGAVAVAQQGPRVAPPGALGEHLDRGIEPDGDRAGLEQVRACAGRRRRRRRWR